LVCKRKRDDAGNVVRYKVRYVAKGYTQRYGIDYDKTTAPTARLESFRALLHIGASLGWDIQQYDVKTAFLHGVLPPEETMFMEQPPGFEAPGKEEWVMRLMKSIYGMKQASRVYNKTFDQSVQAWGFKRVPCEWCVYHRTTTSGTIIFAVHVDDIVSIASSAEENNRFKSDLDGKWIISDLKEAPCSPSTVPASTQCFAKRQYPVDASSRGGGGAASYSHSCTTTSSDSMCNSGGRGVGVRG
jgi:hypothetical protein